MVFKKHNGPTPADDIAPQIITDCGNLTLDFKQLGLWSSPPFLQTLGPWFTNEIQNLLSSEKRTLDHWATVQFFFFFFLTPASVHSLWSSPKFLNWFCLTILISLRFSRLVVHLFLPHFFLPLNFLLTCLDTALCEQLLWQWMFVAYPPCEGCQWSSSGQLSDQQSSPWLCSLVNQTSAGV